MAGCAGLDSSHPQPAIDLLPTGTSTETSLEPLNASPQAHATKPPIATAVPFVYLPSSTPDPTATSLSNKLLPGYGNGPSRFPADINPLTGKLVTDPSILEPMVVKITNYPRSVRPQWGLNLADHIYEYYLEEELTRFAGVFYGQDASRVGPIRSARPFDEHLVRMYKGIFAFAYADDRVIDPWTNSDIKNFLVIERPGNCPPMCRIGSKQDYNTLYTDTHLLSQYISERGTNNDRQNLDGLRFEDFTLILSGGGQANHVEIRFSPSSYSYWDYDPLALRYLRWQETDRRADGEEIYQPLFDSLSGEQVACDNLVVLLVPTGYFFQSNSTEIYDIHLLGKGEGYAMRNGKIFKIVWKRPTREAMLSLVWPDGSPYPLKPGNVWFEVLSDVSPHKVNGPSWRFSFILPGTP